MPAINFDNVEIFPYEIDKIERKVENNQRPSGCSIFQHKNILIVWPTKLALAPLLAEGVFEKLGERKNYEQPVFDNDLKIADYPWIK